MLRRLGLLAVLAAVACLPVAAPAAAATPEPAWSIHSLALPTNFSEADNAECLSTLGVQFIACDAYQVTATDTGAKATSGAIDLADTLPTGLKAQKIELYWSGNLTENLGPADCTLATVSCHYPDTPKVLAAGENLEMVIYVTVEPSAPESLLNSAKVTGGGAPEAITEAQNLLSSTPPPFGPIDLSNLIAGPAGETDTQAGGHPSELLTRIDLASTMRISPAGAFGATSVEDARDVAVDLPLGFLGTALATPTCTFAQLSSNSVAGAGGCPTNTILGHIRTEPKIGDSVNGPIYNMTPEHGVPAELGFVDELGGSHVLYASVVPGPEGYLLRTTGPELPQVALTDIVTNLYGDPAARDANRAEAPADTPFFTNPSDCSGKPLVTAVHADSWQHPGRFLPDGEPDLSDPAWKTTSTESPPVTGCSALAGLFQPKLEAVPTTNQGDSPTGLEVTLKVPQSEGVGSFATPPLRKAVVTLPEGMSVNPSSANGLAGCSLAQIGISATGRPNGNPPDCPEASKIGTVSLITPDLAGTLQGAIYVAKQSENPFGSLLAIYIVVNDPRTGVTVKIPGEVRANPTSGQLETIVDNSPQFPFEELQTKFFGGQQAALRTPAVCGTYKVTSTLTPWSAPQSGPPATPSGTFKITQGCAPSASAEPNSPSFSAGTLEPIAGAYSPFVLKLRREDGSQELKGLNVTLPPGLIGKLAGISECSGAQLAIARGREHEGGGAAELASPSCPSSSEVGTVTVGAGAGLTPFYTTGKAYLSGPYKGAPLSLAIVTPAVAGPYDLGTVVVQAALQVNPETAQITAVSDEIPHILHGIPLDVRSIALNMGRREFTLNPTSCERKAIAGVATSVAGQGAALTSPFQVGGCGRLPFAPRLSLKLKGATTRAKHPALSATLTAAPGEANIASAQVTLPHSAFLDNAHIKTICTRVQFAASQCPAASIYGHAIATTPLLSQPLSGNVYLRSSSHKLPDLVAVLKGQIEVDLDGRIDTGKGGGIRNTFEVVPDAPVSSFTLAMEGGAKGLLQNSENICSKPQRALARFTAQSGKVDDFSPLIANSCKKGARKGHKGGGKKHRGGRR